MNIKFKTPENSTSNLIILEEKPHTRTLNFLPYSNKKGYITDNIVRLQVKLPYLVFILRYRRWHDRFIFNNYSFQIVVNNKPLESFYDDIYSSLTEGYSFAPICTPHEYDNYICKSEKELISDMIGVWWNLPHIIIEDNYNQLVKDKEIKITPFNSTKLNCVINYYFNINNFLDAKFTNIKF